MTIPQKRKIKDIVEEIKIYEELEKQAELNNKNHDRKLIDGLVSLMTGNDDSNQLRSELIDEYRYIKGTHIEANPNIYYMRYRKKPSPSRSFLRAKSLLSLCQQKKQSGVGRPNSFEARPMFSDPFGHGWIPDLYLRYRAFINTGFMTGVMHPKVQNYFKFLSSEEYDMKHGSPEDVVIHGDEGNEEYSISMINNSCWTSIEKKKFFMALERCGRHNIDEISRRIGPTKTVVEVAAYLNLLDGAAKNIEKPKNFWDIYSAREMSDVFILQEEQMARTLDKQLEVESFSKHQALIYNNDNELVKRAVDLFEVWNMSSLTRLFAGKNDMTVLTSTLVQYYQLLRQFILDILINLQTELGPSKDSLVTRRLMNRAIAKRQKLWSDVELKADRRLEDMDIMSMLDGLHRRNEYISSDKSASFLAKRRREGWMKESENSNEPIEIASDSDVYEVESSSEGENPDSCERITSTKKKVNNDRRITRNKRKSNEDLDFGSSEEALDEDLDEEQDTDQDDMMQPFDEEDDLDGYYWDKPDDFHMTKHADIDESLLDVIDEEEEEIMYAKEAPIDLVEDEIIEERMKTLDAEYENKLSKQLEFFNKEKILSQFETLENFEDENK